MLPSSKRLSTSLFKETIKNGFVCNTSIAIIYTKKPVEVSRFSVSVPKKVSKTAVLRNKIRRRAYSIIKVLYSRTSPSVHSVLVMKKDSEKMSFKKLSEEIEKAFVKCGILK